MKIHHHMRGGATEEMVKEQQMEILHDSKSHHLPFFDSDSGSIYSE